MGFTLWRGGGKLILSRRHGQRLSSQKMKNWAKREKLEKGGDDGERFGFQTPHRLHLNSNRVSGTTTNHREKQKGKAIAKMPPLDALKRKYLVRVCDVAIFAKTSGPRVRAINFARDGY
ncbi:hypothetical protein Trydic_g20588 [Trypoxylus dichotomus]